MDAALTSHNAQNAWSQALGQRTSAEAAAAAVLIGDVCGRYGQDGQAEDLHSANPDHPVWRQRKKQNRRVNYAFRIIPQGVNLS